MNAGQGTELSVAVADSGASTTRLLSPLLSLERSSVSTRRYGVTRLG